MRRILVALVAGLALVAALAARLGLLSGPLVGAEDNGDGFRLFCGAGLLPDTVDHIASWKGGVVTDFVRGALCDDPTPGSALLVIKAAAAGHRGVWSLGVLGWFYVVLAGLVVAVTVWVASAGRLRNAAVVAVPAAPLLLTSFSRFMVSTFGEPAGLLGTLAVACGVAALAVTRAHHRAARVVALLVVAGGGLVAATAKVAFLPVLVVAVLACVVTAVGGGAARSGFEWRRRVLGPVLAVVTVAVALAPLSDALARQDQVYASANAHDVVFTLVLREVGPGAAAELGLPPQAVALTGNGFYNGPPRPDGQQWWASTVVDRPDQTRRAAWAVLARHPTALARGLGVGLQATLRADLPYLASTPADPSRLSVPSGDPGWSGAQQPNLQTVLDASRRPPWVPTVLVLLCLVVALAGLLRGGPARRWGGAAALAAATALGLVGVAVLGDGYFEIFKHVWLAAYLLVVAALCVLGALVSLLRGGRFGARRRRSAFSPEQ